MRSRLEYKVRVRKQCSSYSSDELVTIMTSEITIEYIAFIDLQIDYFYNEIIIKCHENTYEVLPS